MKKVAIKHHSNFRGHTTYMQHIFSFGKVFNRLSCVLKGWAETVFWNWLNIGKENRRKTSEIVAGDIHLQFYLLLILCPANVVLVRNT